MTDPKSSALNTQIGGNHYSVMDIQPAEYILRNKIGYAEGNVIKYVSRWRSKGGISDLRKARHYLDLLIEIEESLAPNLIKDSEHGPRVWK